MSPLCQSMPSPHSAFRSTPPPPSMACTAFLNGLRTLTQGVDLTAQLSHRLRRYGPGQLDLGGQLQRDQRSRGSHRPRRSWRRPGDLLPARYAVQLRAQRACHEGRPDRELVSGSSGASPCARPCTARDKALTTPNGSLPYYDNSQPASASPTWKPGTTSPIASVRDRRQQHLQHPRQGQLLDRRDELKRRCESLRRRRGRQLAGGHALRSLWRLLLRPRDLEVVRSI